MKIFRSHLYRKGFTALELLIVLIIIIILVALALASLDLSRRRARDNQRVAQLQTVILGIQSYYDVCREYPVTLQNSTSNGCPTGYSLRDSIPDLNTLIPSNIAITNQPPLVPGQFLYYAFNTQPSSRCSSYHIGIVLESDNHTALEKKNNFNSLNQTVYSCGTGIIGSGFDAMQDDRILDFSF